MDWDDIKFVRALAEKGSLDLAAAELKVAASTVFRRLKKIEDGLGTSLFDRDRNGYRPTQAGEEVVAAADSVAERIATLEMRLIGAESDLGGVVRLTTPETMWSSLLPILADIRQEHPRILVELIVNATFLNLSRRDADLALRPVNGPPDQLFGRKIGRIGFSVYGPAQGAADGWIALDDTLAHLNQHRWFRQRDPKGDVVMRCDSFLAAQAAVAQGMGRAVLPDFLAATDPGLDRFEALPDQWGTDLWLLTHPELRHSERIKLLMRRIAAGMRARLNDAARID